MPDIAGVARNAISQVRSEGVFATLLSLSAKAQSRYMDSYLGIHTEAHVTCRDLGYADSDYRGYMAVPYGSMNTILSTLRLGPNDVFIDIGCGMGRAVVLAARYPIKRAIGVELAPSLALIANEKSWLVSAREMPRT